MFTADLFEGPQNQDKTPYDRGETDAYYGFRNPEGLVELYREMYGYTNEDIEEYMQGFKEGLEYYGPKGGKVWGQMGEEWSQKYKNSINCSHPKGFSQRAHCQGKKKHNEDITMEMVCPNCGMCETHGDHMMEVKQRLDAKCWKGKHKEGTKIKGGIRVNNCVPNEGVAEGKISVKLSPGKGNGLFATKPIKAGEVITRSEFVPINDQEWDLIKNTTPVKLYGFKLGNKHALQPGPFKFKFKDAEEKALWNKTKFKDLSLSGFMFINGADSPDEVNSEEKFIGNTAEMIATRDIQPGEEIIKQYNVPTTGVVENHENIVAVIDGVRSDRTYNDQAHAHNSLANLVSYRKAKVAELYVNGEKVEHFELGKKYLDFEPKSLDSKMTENIHNVSFIGKFTKDGRNYSLWSKGNYWYELTTSTQDREGGFKHVAEWHDKSLEDIKTLLQQRGFEPKTLNQGVEEGGFDEPLTGWHIVYRKSGNPVHATPSFETKEQAQKYLMTKMFANHQDYKVVHTAGVAEGSEHTPQVGNDVIIRKRGGMPGVIIADNNDGTYTVRDENEQDHHVTADQLIITSYSTTVPTHVGTWEEGVAEATVAHSPRLLFKPGELEKWEKAVVNAWRGRVSINQLWEGGYEARLQNAYLVGVFAEGEGGWLETPQKYKRDMNEAGSPAQQAAIAVAMKKAGKKPKTKNMTENDYEDDEQGSFFVAIYNIDDNSTFVGEVSKRGGCWRCVRGQGKEPYGWGGHTFMSYLTVSDVMTWLNKDYSRGYEIEGPFDNLDDAVQFAEHNFGSLNEQGMAEGFIDDMPADSMVGTMDKIRSDAKSRRYLHLQKLLKRSKNPETIEQIEALLSKEFPHVKQGVAEGSRIKTSSGMYRNLHTGVEYSKPTGQDGHDSYMTPAYMLNHYKKRLAQITAGTHKRPREVAQLKAKIAKLEKQGVTEGEVVSLDTRRPTEMSAEFINWLRANYPTMTMKDLKNLEIRNKLYREFKQQGVAEGHADQQRKIFKKNGKPVGEVGIDRESSPGVGQWYMKCYTYNIDNSGYDSYEEAVAELKHCLKQGVAEGSSEEKLIIKNPEDYRERRKALQQLQLDPKASRDPMIQHHVMKKLAQLNKLAQEKGLEVTKENTNNYEDDEQGMTDGTLNETITVRRFTNRAGQSFFIAQTTMGREEVKMKGNTADEAKDNLEAEIQRRQAAQPKATGNVVNIDFNAQFAHSISKNSLKPFWAKIQKNENGNLELIIANPQMEQEFGGDIAELGFLRSAVRVQSGERAGTVFPSLTLTPNQFRGLDLVANGRYVLTNWDRPRTDKDNNTVYDLRYDSTTSNVGDKVHLRVPAFTVAVPRPKTMAEAATSTRYVLYINNKPTAHYSSKEEATRHMHAVKERLTNKGITDTSFKIKSHKDSSIAEARKSQYQRSKESCRKGYKKVGTKASPTYGASVRVNDCKKISEGVKLYYSVIGTPEQSLQEDFKMQHDAQGWYLTETSGKKAIWDAQRAFGSPVMLEAKKSKSSKKCDESLPINGGTGIKGDDNFISPVGSVPHSQIK